MSWQGGQYGASGFSESLGKDPRARRNMQMSLMSQLRYGPGLMVDKNGAIIPVDKAGVDQAGGGPDTGGVDLRYLLRGVDAPPTDTANYQRPESGGYLSGFQSDAAGAYNATASSIDVSMTEPKPIAIETQVFKSDSTHTVFGGGAGGGNSTYAIADIWPGLNGGIKFSDHTTPRASDSAGTTIQLMNEMRWLVTFHITIKVKKGAANQEYAHSARSRFKWFTQDASGNTDQELWYREALNFRYGSTGVLNEFGGLQDTQHMSGTLLIDLSAVDHTTAIGAYTKIGLYTNRPPGQESQTGNMQIVDAEVVAQPVGAINDSASVDVQEFANPITGAAAAPVAALKTGIVTAETNANTVIGAVGGGLSTVDDVTSDHISAYNNALAALQQEVMLIREIIQSLSGGGPS